MRGTRRAVGTLRVNNRLAARYSVKIHNRQDQCKVRLLAHRPNLQRKARFCRALRPRQEPE